MTANHSFRRLTVESLEARELLSINVLEVPAYSSMEKDAKYVIFLDFNGDPVVSDLMAGHTDGTAPHAYDTDGDPDSFSEKELQDIEDIWKGVAEMYAPFNINVTTVDPGDDYAGKGTHVVFCTITDGGGWGWVGVTNYGRNAIVGLGQGVPYTIQCVAHEVGHNLGLDHDGQEPGDGEYYGGHSIASGVTWAPVMGGGRVSTILQWSKGEYIGATNTYQDDLAIIAATAGYRADEATVKITNANKSNLTGTIAASGDSDAFTFSVTEQGRYSFSVTAGVTLSSGRAFSPLYYSFVITNDIGQTVFSSKSGLSSAAVNTGYLNLAAGNYTAIITGIGYDSPSPFYQGFTKYGSLGTYKIVCVGTISEKPAVPAALSIVNIYATSAIVKMPLLRDTGGANSYKLRIDGPTDSRTITVPAANYGREYTLTGLTAYTRYTLRLIAVNNIGETDGHAVTFVTLEAAPAPKQPFLVSSTSTSITVSWDPLNEATGYILYYRTTRIDGNWKIAFDANQWIETTVTTVTLTADDGIKPNEVYDFRVCATNDDGVSSFSPVLGWVVAKQMDPSTVLQVNSAADPVHPDLPDKVDELTSAAADSTHIAVSWTAANKAESYTLQYRETIGGTTWQTVEEDITDLFFMFTAKENTGYDFRVQAKNSAGTSAYSDVLEAVFPILNIPQAAASEGKVKTSYTAPVIRDADVGGVAGYNESNSITLTFFACDNVLKKTTYVIKAKTGNTTKTFTVKSQNTNSTRTGYTVTDNDGIATITVYLTGLKAGKDYSFTIQTKTDSAHNASAVTRVSPLVRTWAKVATPTLKASTTTSSSITVKITNWKTLSGVDTMRLIIGGQETLLKYDSVSKKWSAEGSGNITFEDGVLRLDGLTAKKSYKIQIAFSGEELVSSSLKTLTVTTKKA